MRLLNFLIRDILDVLHVRNHSANRKWTIDDIPGGIPHLCGDIQSSIEAWSQDSGTTKPRSRSCQGEMLVGFRRDRRRCILDTYRFSKCEDVCQSNLHAALMFAHVWFGRWWMSAVHVSLFPMCQGHTASECQQCLVPLGSNWACCAREPYLIVGFSPR